MTLPPRTRNVLAWALWLATMGCCAAGLVTALLLTRPLTAQVLLEGAVFALGFPFGYATVGLVLTLRRPANRSAGCTRPRPSPGAWSSPSAPGSTSWSGTGSRCPWPPS
jgi:hypothetical protein